MLELFFFVLAQLSQCFLVSLLLPVEGATSLLVSFLILWLDLPPRQALSRPPNVKTFAFGFASAKDLG